MKKRIISALLALVTLIGLMPMMATEADAFVTGKVNETLVWEIDEEGTLTISGTGAMWTEGYAQPWADYYYLEDIKYVVIEEGITTIGDYAFAGCCNLTGITIPESVTDVGRSAFGGCSSLTSFAIPDGMDVIGKCTFAGCSSLTSISIPASVTEIDVRAFEDCESLTDIYITDLTAWLRINEDIWFGMFLGYWDGANPSPMAVNDLGKRLYLNGELLTEVVIPDSFNEIGPDAFKNCTSITSVTIPRRVNGIYENAFSGCYNLQQIVFHGDAPVVFHADARDDIYEDVFAGVEATAYYPAGNNTWTEEVMESFGGSITWVVDDKWYCGDSLTATLDEAGTLTISGIGDMYDDAPWQRMKDDIKSVVISDGITGVSDDAFADCSSLTGIWVSEANSVYCNDEAGVLYNKDKTELIFIPEGIETEVLIPDSVDNIPIELLTNCVNLKGIRVNESNPNYSCDSYGVLFDKNKTTLLCVPTGLQGAYVIPDGVTSVNKQALACSKLTSIGIPDSMSDLQVHVMKTGRKLEEFQVNETNPNYSCDSSGVLFNKNQTSLLCAPAGMTGSYAIPDGVISIGESAFSECAGLTDVTIPNSVRKIGDSAFAYCESLTSMTIPNNVTQIGDRAFEMCTSLSSIIIPDSVTEIGAYAFSVCESLVSVILPIGVTQIDDGVFIACGSLESVTIPDGVTRIGWCAFEYSALTSITIPDSVTEIDEWAFDCCESLREVYFEGNAPAIISNAFDYVTATAYYPEGNSTWTEEIMQDYGGILTWVAYEPGTLKNGWVQENGAWYYYEEGTKLTGQWLNDGGTWYYLDDSGVMATGWAQVDGKWYYFSENGAMQTGWLKIGGTWYYLGNEMKTGWVKIDSKWYYFSTSGAMQTGWVNDGGKWYYLNSAMHTGWLNDGGKWYYLNSEMKTGWQQIGGSWYYLNTEMKTGWVKSGNYWYYLLSNGKMAADQWVGGNGKWYFVDGNGRMLENQWLQRSGKWYYLGNNGLMVTGTHTINGTEYTFNDNGVWVS